jgi:hypothetical protein
MVTNYPQQLTAATTVAHDPVRDTGLMTRAIGRFGQLLCGMRGHDSVLHFEANRVMMRCTSCGHDSPGWEINERAPRHRFDGDARRHALNQPRLVLKRSA